MKTIFVSSTFRDMDLERDAIQQIVYPRLNKAARQHGQSISFCDLRWGIDTSLLESESGSRKVLDVCLEEIDRCQPPMVVILGYRYGWIPSRDLVASTASRYALALDDLEKSVTALEVEYGALANPDRLANTLFYFREIEGMPPEDFLPEDTAHAARLAALKDRIRNLTGGRIRSYTLRWEQDSFQGIEHFADILTQDLTDILQPQWLQDESLSPFQKELRIHTNYRKEKAAAFRARKTLAEQVLSDIEAGKPLTILNGAVGSGKSTLLSHIAEQLQNRGWDTVAFFSNLTPQTGTAADLQALIISYLEQALGPDAPQAGSIAQNLAGTPLEQLQTLVDTQTQKDTREAKQRQQRLEQLCTFYGKSGRKLVILIDAIDQLFPDEARDELIFLPTVLGDNVRYIMTCLPQTPVKGHDTVTIPPIDDRDKEQVIRGILDFHNRELSPTVLNAMLALPASHNPLYLSFLVQRLMMMNRQDFNAIRSQGDGMDAITRQQLHVLESCPDNLEAMSAELMDTAAERIGSAMVPQALSYLAFAPHGLRVTDLSTLLGSAFHTLDFAHFISYMNDCFVRRTDGRYDFSHKSIREGLLRRCETPSSVHRKLLDHFRSLDPDDDIRRQEILYHCIYADDKAFYAEYIHEIIEQKIDPAIQHAAKVTYASTLLDDGNWLTDLLDNTAAENADWHLPYFIYKHYDRQTASRSEELDMLYRVHKSNAFLAKKVAKHHKQFIHWRSFGYALEALSDITEAKGTQTHIEEANSYRKIQLTIAEALYEQDSNATSPVTVRYLARAHQNLAANMQLRLDENVTETRTHLSKALALRQQLAEIQNNTRNQAELAKLYLKLAMDYSGFFHSDDALADEYGKKALELYQNLYDTTGELEYLTQLAEVYGHLSLEKNNGYFLEDQDGEEVSDHAKNGWYKKQIAILETVAAIENSLHHRQLLGSAYISLVNHWLHPNREVASAYAQKAVTLFRSIVRERGTIDDLRNLSNALITASSFAQDECDKESLTNEAIAIRQDLYQQLSQPADQDFLAETYHNLSLRQNDPAQQEALESKAKSLGYIEKGKAFTEILEILRHMDREYVDKIPKKVVMYLYDKCDLTYDFRMTETIGKQEFLPLTLNILSILLQSFWKNEGFAMGDVALRNFLGNFR